MKKVVRMKDKNKALGKARWATIRIAPSLLAADFARLGDDIAKVQAGGADMLHLDVMDGHFVPNITFGPALIAGIRKVTDLFLDVHLMIQHPEDFIEPFIQAGAENVTFHIEVAKDPIRMIEQIHQLGSQAGLCLNPQTQLSSLEPVLDKVEMVLVMTVEPGFGGQGFMTQVLPKISALADRLAPHQHLEVDGGISDQTVAQVVTAGADTLVAGTSIFGQDDPAARIGQLRDLATRAQQAQER